MSIGHRCPHQNAIQKKVTYVIVSMSDQDFIQVYSMELSQGQIIHKPNKQELSSMFITHRLNVMHASVNFHKYIPYSLGVMAHTPFTI